MKFLLRSGWGESLALALRLMKEGHDVRMSIFAKESARVGQGLVRHEPDFGKGVQWADVVVYDDNIFELPDEAQRVKTVRPVMGSGHLAGELENDRALAVSFARRAGLDVPEFESFEGPTAWALARKFLHQRDEDEKWVWKPNGEAPVSTYVAEGVAELDRMFDYWAKLYEEHKNKPSFILTQAIDGYEISTEAWFDGQKFVLHNHTIEKNRLFPGGLGEKTGCAGNVVWVGKTPLHDKLIEPLAEHLRGRYWGPIDVNCIIEEESNEAVFLEFTPRFGYDAVVTLLRLVDSPLGELLAGCALGRAPVPTTRPGFAAGVRVHVPPYPCEPAEMDTFLSVGLPIFGLDAQRIRPGFEAMEVMLDGKGRPVTSGPEGVVYVATGVDSNIDGAFAKAYKVPQQVKIPTARWSEDLHKIMGEVYDGIGRAGWLSQPTEREALREQRVSVFNKRRFR